MKISSQQVEQVVTAISAGAGDPQHVAVLVGEFMQSQPMVGHYVTAQLDDFANEGVVLMLLHAAVVGRMCEVARGRKLLPLSASDLDRADSSGRALKKTFDRDEPEVASYLEGNVTVEDATLGGKRRDAALHSLRVIARALLDQ